VRIVKLVEFRVVWRIRWKKRRNVVLESVSDVFSAVVEDFRVASGELQQVVFAGLCVQYCPDWREADDLPVDYMHILGEQNVEIIGVGCKIRC
jgi:hypothetical protein